MEKSANSRLFTEQIEFDLRYFQNGAIFLEKAITAIQGRMEIEQAERDRITQNLLRQKEASDKERDRNFQTTIAIISVSLGAAGIGTSTARYIIPQQPIKPILPPFATNRLHPSAQSVLLSLSFGLVGAIIAGILSYVIQNRSAIIEPIVKFIRLDSKHTS